MNIFFQRMKVYETFGKESFAYIEIVYLYKCFTLVNAKYSQWHVIRVMMPEFQDIIIYIELLFL